MARITRSGPDHTWRPSMTDMQREQADAPWATESTGSALLAASCVPAFGLVVWVALRVLGA